MLQAIQLGDYSAFCICQGSEAKERYREGALHRFNRINSAFEGGVSNLVAYSRGDGIQYFIKTRTRIMCIDGKEATVDDDCCKAWPVLLSLLE